MILSILSLICIVAMVGYLGYVIASIFKQTLASELYIRVGITSIFFIIVNIPLLSSLFLSSFMGDSIDSWILVSRFIASVGRLLFIAALYKLFTIKFNLFNSNLGLIMILIVVLGILFNISLSNEWSSVIPSIPIAINLLPIEFVRNIPTTILGLLLALQFFQVTRMSENKSLEFVPVFIALIVMLQLVQVFDVSLTVIAIAYLIQIIASIGIIHAFFKDFKKSFYY